MLHRFQNLLKRFRRDERGAFLVLFGVLALVLIATSGAVVDFTSIEQARTRAQNALDAAALGLQPHVFDVPAKSNDWFIGQANNLLAERLGDASLASTVTGASYNARNGQLILEANVVVPTSFVSLLGFEDVRASLLSEATRKRLNIEVAMVLDNSGSMSSSSRMTKLKEAARSATDILFDNQPTQPNVFISIIPFTQYVNVGTANRNAAWMSQTGASSHSHLNFDDDDNEATPFNSTVNRWALYDGFNNESWAGCVEARATPFDTDDTVPDNAVPDTMFQPVFAPDGPEDNYISDTGGSCTRVPPVWTYVQTKTNCNKNGNNSQSNYDTASCNNSVSNSYSMTNVNGDNVNPAPTTKPANNSLAAYYNVGDCSTSYSSTRTSTNPSRYTNRRTETCVYDFSAVEYQQRLCKYDNRSFSGSGPNSDCPSTAILPLNNTRDTIKARITAMVASGSTNIEQGAIWGFHSLSPTEPLTEGRSYDEATSKVMIVMTDGENNVNYDSYSNSIYGVSSYMAWGFRSDKRLLTEATTPKDSVASSGQVIGEVNRRTELACTNAKNAGIIVYTIGLSVPNASTRTMLENCATPDIVVGGATTTYSFFPSSSSELVTVFEEIAEQLSELRLAQ